VHNLRTERFFEPRVINDHTAIGDGPIKTFPLRGIKDTPPYLHDGRLLTLDDTVEFFNLILRARALLAGEARPGQYSLAPITSPPERVASFCQTPREIRLVTSEFEKVRSRNGLGP
jgi:hypothetical protein